MSREDQILADLNDMESALQALKQEVDRVLFQVDQLERIVDDISVKIEEGGAK